MAKKGIVPYFMAGLMVVVLLILSGIVGLIVQIILGALLITLGVGPIPILLVAIVVGIIVLGWTFTTFMVRKR